MRLFQGGIKRNPRFAGRQDGTVIIEAALIIPIFIIALYGLIEIASFIMVKQRISKAAEELSTIMSTIPRWDPGIHVVPMLRSAQFSAWPFGVTVAVQFCQRGEGAWSSPTYAGAYPGRNFPAGGCAFQGGGSGGGATVGCGDGGALPITSQYVVVGAGCTYSPLFNFVGLFDGVPMQSKAVAPMRYLMPWAIPIAGGGGGAGGAGGGGGGGGGGAPISGGGGGPLISD